MGQKIHPIGFRVGITRDWESRWFAPKKQYSQMVYEDHQIRKAIKSRWYNAGISRIEIERAANTLRVIIFAAKPGQLIGKGGKGIEEITQLVAKVTGHQNSGTRVNVDIQDIRNPETDAQLVAENIAQQLEKRISHRRAMRQSLTRAQRANVKGIKMMVSGRLNGAEIARTEWDRQGRVPLQTLRADIDYGFATAFTIYGTVGVKVWIYKGDIPMSERKMLLSTISTPEGAFEAPRRGDRPGGRGDRPGGGGDRRGRGNRGSGPGGDRPGGGGGGRRGGGGGGGRRGGGGGGAPSARTTTTPQEQPIVEAAPAPAETPAPENHAESSE